jgi:hypothetical protein
MKKMVKNNVMVLVLVIVVVFAGVLYVLNWNSNISADGTCARCGGHYHVVDYVGHRHTTTAIVECEECGNTMEVDVQTARELAHK